MFVRFEMYSNMSNTNILSVGDINEKGYLSGMTRRGFTPAKCNLELAANTFDSHDVLGNQDEGMLLYDIRQSNVRLIDNAGGMNNEDIRNAFSMHRENHISETSRGVSGMGGKTAMRILSRDRNMIVYTKKPDGPYTRIDIPWATIVSEGIYTGKVQTKPMKDDEKESFVYERYSNNMSNGPVVHGTTIEFPSDNELEELIKNNFSSITESEVKNPLDRMDIVFGREKVKIGMKTSESSEIKILEKYDYFGLPNTSYYRGVSTYTIEQWTKGNEHRFLLQLPDGTYEINKHGSGFKKDPEPSTSNTNGYHHVGDYEVRVGLRNDPAYFDNTNPRFPQVTTNIYGIDKKFLDEDKYDYLAYFKIYRNNMLIGLIPCPEVAMTSIRGGNKTNCEYYRVQLDVSFNPLSTQNNAMDRAMNIQENKNQFDGKSLPIRFTRLLKWIRKQKSEEIWEYFTNTIAMYQAENAPSEDEEEEVDDAPTPAPAPVPAPAPATPATTNVLDQLDTARQANTREVAPLPESDTESEDESPVYPPPPTPARGRTDFFGLDTSTLGPIEYANFMREIMPILQKYSLELD